MQLGRAHQLKLTFDLRIWIQQ